MKSKKLVAIILTTIIAGGIVQQGEIAISNEINREAVSINNNGLSGKLAQAYKVENEFDGNATFIDISEDIESVKSLNEGAISIGFNSTGTGDQILFSMADSKEYNSYIIVKLLNGKLRYEVRENGVQKIGYTYNALLNDGEDHKVIINQGDRGSELYIDGVKVFTVADQDFFLNDVNTPDTMTIGAIRNSLNLNGFQFFNGYISNVSIYKEQLDEKEAIYLTDGSNAISYNVKDVEFDGVSQLVDVSEDIEFVESLEEGAIAIEFESESARANQVLFSMTDANDPNSHIMVKLLNGSLRYEVRENGVQTIGYTYKAQRLNDGEKHRVVLNQGTEKSELYIDGVKVFTTDAETGYFSEVSSPNNMTIGAIKNSRYTNGVDFFEGTIHSIDIYKEELAEEDALEKAIPSPDVEQEYNRLIDLIHGEEDINIVFTGDSLTQASVATEGYRSYSEHLNERISGEAIDGNRKNETFIFNTGVANAKAIDIINNYDKVIGNHDADIVFMMIGMNDCVTVSLEQYEENVREIVGRIREAGSLPVLQTSNATTNRAVVGTYMEKLREIAEDLGVVLIDHYAYWEENIGDNINDYLYDPVHPNKEGQLVMAKYLMEELQLDTEDSFTYNLEYPLTTAGAYIDKTNTYEYPDYVGIEGHTPVVSYRVEEEISEGNTIDISEDIEKVAGLNEGTIVARFNLTDEGNGQTIISLSDSRDHSSNASLTINAGKLHYEVREAGDIIRLDSTQDTYNDGQWHTVVLTTEPGSTKVYIDGELIITDTNTGFFGNIKTPDSFNIGMNVDNTGDQWYYNGKISYVDVYSEVLTEEKAIEVSGEAEVDHPESMNLTEARNKALANAANPWVFLGDEDTSSNGDTYGYRNFVEYFEERVRWELKGRDMNSRRKFMINSGVDGATSTEILANFDEWAGIHRPSVVSVMIGGRETVSVEEFEANLRAIVDEIEAIGATVVLQTPVIKNENVVEYIDVIREVATERGVGFIDHYEFWDDIENTQPEIRESWLTEDGSPNHRGHLEIVKKMMIEMDINGGIISNFEIPYEDQN